MIDPLWRRICGLHIEDEGHVGAVWIAHDKETDTLHAYDCAIVRKEVLAVISECLNSRGRWIPIAWEKSAKAMADQLIDRGCNMLPETDTETKAIREMSTREIWERMRTGRFKVDKRLSEWLDEYKTFNREDSQVPNAKHPLMSATRHAVAQLDYAIRQRTTHKTQRNFPKVAIV